MVNGDGSIDSRVTLNNKGGESVRFGHIHHLNTGAATGPIIWWLSSPIGTDLNLTDQHLQFAQLAAFVSNTHIADFATALSELLASAGLLRELPLESLHRRIRARLPALMTAPRCIKPRSLRPGRVV